MCAAEGGDGGTPSSDAMAERIAKARAYKLGGQSELEDAVTKATVDAAKRAAGPPPPDKRQVKVTIMTKDNNYNPFDDDEKAVGFEEGDNVYVPSAGEPVHREPSQRRPLKSGAFTIVTTSA